MSSSRSHRSSPSTTGSHTVSDGLAKLKSSTKTKRKSSTKHLVAEELGKYGASEQHRSSTHGSKDNAGPSSRSVSSSRKHFAIEAEYAAAAKLASPLNVASPQKLMPGKKKKKKPTIDFSVDGAASSSNEAEAMHKRSSRHSSSAHPHDDGLLASEHGLVSKTRSSSRHHRSSAYEIAGLVSHKTLEEEERHFREEAVVNQLSTPKKIKKKPLKSSSIAVADAIRMESQNDEHKVGSDDLGTALKSSKSRQQASDDEDSYADDFEDYRDDFEDPPDEPESKVNASINTGDLQHRLSAKSPKTQSRKKSNPFAPQIRKAGEEVDEENFVSPAKTSTPTKGAFKRELRKPPRRNSSRRGDREGLQTLDQSENEVGVSMGDTGGRCQEIRSRVTFRKVRIDIFEQHSLPPWEFYMRSVAAGGNRRQAFTQTNDDATEIEIQTEEIPMSDAYTDQESAGQVNKVSANIQTDIDENEEKQIALSGSEEKVSHGDEFEIEEFESEVDAGILQQLELMCIATIEENNVMYDPQFSTKTPKPSKSSNLIDEKIVIRSYTPGLALKSRSINDVVTSNSLRKVFVSVHGPCHVDDVVDEEAVTDKGEAMRISKSSILCLWDLRVSSSEPQWYMSCIGVAKKAVLSPGSVSVVLAGMDDGTLFAWDLRGIEPSIQVASVTNPLPPSYSTAGEMSLDRTHTAEICDLHLISNAATVSTTQLGFQVASLDVDGLLHIWSIMHYSAPKAWDVEDILNNSDSTSKDSGMHMSGNLRFHHMAKIDMLGRGASQDPFSSGFASVAAFQPGISNRVVMGSSDGRIIHASRFGQVLAPRQYKQGSSLHLSLPSSVGLSHTGPTVTCICFNHFLPDFFLAGFDSGAFALYEVHRALPLKKWDMTTTQSASSGSGYASVCNIVWSNRCASAFYVLDGSNTVHAWDLAHKVEESIAHENIPGLAGLSLCGGTSSADLQADTFITRGAELQYLVFHSSIAMPVHGQPVHPNSSSPVLQTDSEQGEEDGENITGQHNEEKFSSTPNATSGKAVNDPLLPPTLQHIYDLFMRA